MKPVVLGPNQPRRFYRGGEAIASFRGIAFVDDHVPEDWVGSTTSIFGEDGTGLTVLPDGRLLRDALAADPQGFLGPGHTKRYGADPALLVKLLDAGERLPVHAHPDGAFAQRHLGLPYGKTEAWLIIETVERDHPFTSAFANEAFPVSDTTPRDLRGTSEPTPGRLRDDSGTTQAPLRHHCGTNKRASSSRRR